MSIVEKVKDLNKNLGKNASTLFMGSFAAQLIPLISSTLIARLFSVAEQGIYAQVNSVMQILSTLADGRIGQAVILPKKDSEANSVIVMSFIYTVIFSVLVWILVLTTEDYIASYFQNNDLKKFLWVSAVFVFLVGIQRSLSYWLIRKDAYKWISILKVSQSTIASAFMLLFGYIQLEGGWLLGYLAGWVGFTLLTIFVSFKKLLQPSQVTKIQLKKSFSQYKMFPIYYGIPGLLVETSKQATIILTSILFSLDETGYFNFSRTIILVPIAMLGVSLGQVLYKRISESSQKQQSIKSEITIISIILASISALMILIVHNFGTELFTFIFSDKWGFSGEISQILIFSYSLQLIVIPLNNILPALNQHKLAAIYPFVYFLAIGSLFFKQFTSFTEFLVILTYTEVFVYSIFALIIVISIIKYEKSITK